MFNPYGQRQYQPVYQPNFNQMYQPQMYQTVQSGIQGKIVDNIDVVKATEISLDGSVNYFPLADGSAIVTKQLQQDGTSRMIVYKPIVNEAPKYITNDDLNNEVTGLKQQIEELRNKLNRLEGADYIVESKANSNEYLV